MKVKSWWDIKRNDRSCLYVQALNPSSTLTMSAPTHLSRRSCFIVIGVPELKLEH